MTTGGGWRPGSVAQRLRKFKGRSFDELRERAAQAISAELERRGLLGASGQMSDAALQSRLDHSVTGVYTDAKTLRAHFTARSTPRFFAGVRSGDAAEVLRSEEWTTARALLLAAADRVLEGRYDLLGHAGLNYGSPIDWHLDPVSGKRGPDSHWSRIPYLDAARVGDHKVIWEINRHQHFMVLGRAWQVTRAPRYAECFADQAMSWMDANPPKRGINWASSLEVSYRAIAWLWAIELFREAPELTPGLLTRMLKYLEVHGHHLERYLSTYFSPNTHLTGEALGLFYLGAMLPELKAASSWREHGWKILVEQLPRQVHADGVYFEQATYYHRYTADIYLHAVMLAQANDLPVAESTLDRLRLTIDHLADLTRADGTIPIIGDDDGGRLVALEQRRFMDVRAVLATASVVLDRAEYAAVAGMVTEEVYWLLGRAGADDANRSIAAARFPEHESKLFAAGGYAIMRDGWHANALHAVIDSGPLGALNCGHAHSDALSVELAAGGCPLIVDPGTYSYTSSPEARDKFRHSSAHNTVTINNEAASVPAGPFSWQHRADARVDAWWAGTLTDRIVGSHPGFERLGIGASHQRAVWFVRGAYWVIVDTVTSSESSQAAAHFHAALGSEVEQQTDRSAVLRVPCRAGWRRLFFGAAGDIEPILWGMDWVSPSYGSRDRAPYARLVSTGAGTRQLISVLCPQGEFVSVSMHELPMEKGRMVVVNRQNTYDQLLLAVDGRVRGGGVDLEGDGALVRRSRETGPIDAMALYGAGARLLVDGLVMTARGAAEAERDVDGWKVTGDGAVRTVS